VNRSDVRSRGAGVLFWVAVAAVLGAGAVIYGVGQRAFSGHAATKPPAQASPGADGRDVELLRRDVALLRAELAVQHRAQVAGTGADRSDGAGAAASAEGTPAQPESAEAQEQRRKTYLAGIAAGFQGEAVDARWSSTAVAAVRAAIDADDHLRRAIRDIECRSRTCKVQLADSGDGSLNKALPVLALRVGQSLPRVDADWNRDDATGTTTVVLYMSRPSS